MSTIAKMTLIGMYEYESELFTGVTLPEGMDKDVFINTLLLSYGEKPVLYSSVTFMQQAIKMWSDKWQDSFQRMYRAVTEDYDPLHNFDRHEEYSDKETKAASGTSSLNGSNSTSSGTSMSGSTDGTDESTVSAYNESTYQPDSKRASSGSSSSEASDHSSGSSSQNGSTSDNENRDLVHSGHLYGNIGVTKSQEMLKDELNVRSKYNIYQVIADLFSDELLLYLY